MFGSHLGQRLGERTKTLSGNPEHPDSHRDHQSLALSVAPRYITNLFSGAGLSSMTLTGGSVSMLFTRHQLALVFPRLRDFLIFTSNVWKQNECSENI